MSNLPPSGEIPRGAIRFNTDSNKPELWDGSQWAEFQLSTPNLGRSVDTEPGARGVYGGGLKAPNKATSVTLEYLNISSTGDATSFGDLTGSNRGWIASCASSTRGVWGAGSDNPGGSRENTIDFITFSSTGDATNFGDLIDGYEGFAVASCSNSTRGLWGSGYYPGGANVNVIQYVTIASTGNAVDFGDLTQSRRGAAGCASATKGLFGSGIISSSVNTIDFVTISTTGNAQDFGDLTFPTRRDGNGSCSNPIRGLWAGGYSTQPPTYTAASGIDSVIITSGGNAVKFGDLSQARASIGSFSSPISAVFLGDIKDVDNYGNMIDYVQFATEGNAVDFGDLITKKGGASGASNAHGGL